ncbi:MAG: sigma-54 interaction domain-containing protein [Phycisphaerales bacterium]
MQNQPPPSTRAIQPTAVGLDGPQLVGTSPAMARLRKLIAAVAARECTVLVQGPSGAGKELVARSVHAQSKRASGPFVAVDCTGLRDTLLESQLFGHQKGSFTGADSSTIGFIRAADGGTLFLDEIGEMDLKTQAKLLRCIQERCVVPLGSVKPIAVNVRVLAATHRDLKKMVSRSEFREDLYFRLDVVRLEVPPLKDRVLDILPLADHFLWQLADLYEEPIKRLSAESKDLLRAYPWPGNVRELANAVEHAVVMCPGEEISPLELPEHLRGGTPMPASPSDGPIVTLESAERTLIARALKATSGNQSRAADMLRIERRRLARKIERYGLKGLTQGE